MTTSPDKWLMILLEKFISRKNRKKEMAVTAIKMELSRQYIPVNTPFFKERMIFSTVARIDTEKNTAASFFCEKERSLKCRRI